MTLQDGLDHTALVQGLEAAGADGWLLFNFRGLNPIADRVLGLGGLGTRRLFVWLPRQGAPVAIAHKIELGPLRDFPGRVIPYARWQELHEALRQVVGGKQVAMEISPRDSVPYLDRVPYGVIELVQSLGATVVPSAPLVTQFASRWNRTETEGHVRAAEALATIAQNELKRVTRDAASGVSETTVQRRVIDAIHAAGLELDHGPIVAFGPNTADPHYEPIAGRDRTLGADQVVLIDLWAGPALGTVFADQTWMGFSGAHPPEKVGRMWETIRQARDAAIERVKSAAAAGQPVRGFEVDDAARGVIERAGFADYFVHRTGHSIDRDLHGSGPHIDDYETRDDRLLMPGVGFSVEPGLYLPGDFGLRTEVNMYWGDAGPVVTPSVPQVELITA
jgi:Xaa-Pro aminopeptidase